MRSCAKKHFYYGWLIVSREPNITPKQKVECPVVKIHIISQIFIIVKYEKLCLGIIQIYMHKGFICLSTFIKEIKLATNSFEPL